MRQRFRGYFRQFLGDLGGWASSYQQVIHITQAFGVQVIKSG